MIKYLLLGGAPDVGKTETIYRLANFLIRRGYVIIHGSIPSSSGDFKVILENKDRGKRILFASASDDLNVLNSLKKFKNNYPNVDIFISSVRDEGFFPRKQFFNLLNISENEDFILEVPLAKITRRGDKNDPKSNRSKGLNWYRDKNDKLLHFILEQKVFSAI